MGIHVDGEAAVRISATYMKAAPSGRSALYDCEGDEVWIPNSVCRYDGAAHVLDIKKWWYDCAEKEGRL
jgi:hypothetical protein